jgi:putative membrane protein
MTELPDPSVFFSAERTLLAWVRSSVATIGLGFVVARFGLFLQLITPNGEATSQMLPAGVGVALVLLGAASCVIATVQFLRYRRSLPRSKVPPGYSAAPSVGLAMTLATIAVVLAVYLLR